MHRNATLLLAILIALTGCASHGRVREISPGVYSASATGDGYVSEPKLREDSLERAEEYCRRHGMRMRLAGEADEEAHAVNATTIRVTFRCVEG